MSLFLAHWVSGTELSRRLTRSTFIFPIQKNIVLTMIRPGFSRSARSAFFCSQFEERVTSRRLPLVEPSFNFSLYILVRNPLSRVQLFQTCLDARDESRLFLDSILLFRHY